MRIKLILTSLALAALIVGAGFLLSGDSAAAASGNKVNPFYKGGSSFNLAGAGPNVARCGAQYRRFFRLHQHYDQPRL
jgi:hypothetical protein